MLAGFEWGEAAHRTIADLPRLIGPKDLVVVNNTKVIPARLFGQRGNVKVEATLVRHHRANAWWALARPGKRLKPGQIIHFADGLSAEMGEKIGAEILLTFNKADTGLLAAIKAQGAMPLPPY